MNIIKTDTFHSSGGTGVNKTDNMVRAVIDFTRQEWQTTYRLLTAKPNVLNLMRGVKSLKEIANFKDEFECNVSACDVLDLLRNLAKHVIRQEQTIVNINQEITKIKSFSMIK